MAQNALRTVPLATASTAVRGSRNRELGNPGRDAELAHRVHVRAGVVGADAKERIHAGSQRHGGLDKAASLEFGPDPDQALGHFGRSAPPSARMSTWSR